MAKCLPPHSYSDESSAKAFSGKQKGNTHVVSYQLSLGADTPCEVVGMCTVTLAVLDYIKMEVTEYYCLNRTTVKAKSSGTVEILDAIVIIA